MKVSIVYNYPVFDGDHSDYALRFVLSYAAFPPGYPHDTYILVNGGRLTNRMRNIIECIAGLPNVRYIEKASNEGKDISGYQWACNFLTGPTVFFGGPAHFKRAGWLKRLVDVWDKVGPSMLGTMASYLQRPHLQTTGFMTSPEFIRKWGKPCVTTQDRYAFEWGMDAFWRRIVSWKMPALLVTWDGEYPPERWREPANCLWRGDQSNCLSYFRHSDTYDDADAATRQRMNRMADGLENDRPEQVESRQKFESSTNKTR